MCKEPVAWCPYHPIGGYEISAVRRKKSTVERYIAASGRRAAIAVPLCACKQQEIEDDEQ